MCSFFLIFNYLSDILYIWGVPENGKRFAFRRNKYILGASSILEVIPMENKVKGTGYDVRNNNWHCQHCGNGYQHHRYYN
jgi:hypothetical protein